MKLNNKGWGLGTFILYLGVFAIFITIVTLLALHNANMIHPDKEKENLVTNTTVGTEENTTIDYKELENSLLKAADEYQKEHLKGLKNGDIKYITATKLEELKLLDNLTDGNTMCTGYAKITYEDKQSDIVSFINCGEYITEGYNEELDK